MKLYFAGAETPTLRKTLLEAGVRRVSFNYLHAIEGGRNTDIEAVFPADVEVLLESGASSAPETCSEQHWREHEENYLDWAQRVSHRAALVTEFDPPMWNRAHLERRRAEVWDQLDPEVFLPVWHGENLADLAGRYPNIAVVSPALKGLRDDIERCVTIHGTRFHGLAFSSMRGIEDLRLSSCSSTSWTAPMRFGETCIWDGRQLHRYNGSRKEEARRRHREDILRAGFNYDAVLADDRDEVTRMAIWSWLQWEAHVSRSRATPSAVEAGRPAGASEAVSPATSAPTPRKSKVLPILDVVTPLHRLEDGSELQGPPEVRLRSSSARRCDTCYIRGLCPEFEAGATCAFDIPVELRTKDQLVALLRGMIEMQSQRVAFARYAEELEGGAPSKTVSVELDRLFDLTQRLKDIQDDREFLRLSVETRGQAGILSRIFGDRVGEEARALNAPLDERATNALMADVIDAQVIE